MKDLKMIGFLIILSTICTIILTAAFGAYKMAEPMLNRRFYAGSL